MDAQRPGLVGAARAPGLGRGQQRQIGERAGPRRGHLPAAALSLRRGRRLRPLWRPRWGLLE
eukprot:15477129-Alexandrium_andersonii.AAC.1